MISTDLDSHELVLFQLVLVQQLFLLFRSHDHVLRDKLMLGQVDEELGLEELLQHVLWHHVLRGGKEKFRSHERHFF